MKRFLSMIMVFTVMMFVLMSGGQAAEPDGDGYAIKRGMQGSDVAEVQNILIAMGYMSGEADGICGESMISAIKKFQASVGLEADGVAGVKTLDMLSEAARMFEEAAAVKEETQKVEVLKPLETKPVPNDNAEIGSVIKSGMRGAGVMDVQKKLIEHGFLKGEADGICGAATVAAIKRFQASVGLPSDGVCGLMTYAALEDASFTSDTMFEVVNTEPTYGNVIFVEATAYSAYDPGNGSYTARGTLLRKGIIAVDPSVIPLGTRVYIPGYGEAIADDTGGAIVGNRIDIAFDSHEEAIMFGRQSLEIYIID